jgi:hypothetical protein
MSAMKNVVVATQSNYIPWKGYFDQILSSDQFILLDCVQYTRRDWRNRNKIKTPQGLQWLTIPVEVRGRYTQAIDETRVSDAEWVEKHVRSLEGNYRRAPYFETEAPWLFAQMRQAAAHDHLSEINRHLICALCERIGITTPVVGCGEVLGRDALVAMDPSDRLLELCKAAQATHYLSGPAAKDYLNVAAFERENIQVLWMSYENYPPYPQQWGEFTHGVSIVDLLLNVGAADALTCLRREAA